MTAKAEKKPKIIKPLVAGVKKAPDGHWYMPDPARPGKYLRVIQTEVDVSEE